MWYPTLDRVPPCPAGSEQLTVHLGEDFYVVYRAPRIDACFQSVANDVAGEFADLTGRGEPCVAHRPPSTAHVGMYYNPVVWHVYPTMPHGAQLQGAILKKMASTPVSAEKRKRRTQAERRATTRTALLDAAIGCLVEEGYANTTTRRIAQRAGVSPGALQHHFVSKAELLGETLHHIRAKWASEMFAQGVPNTPSIPLRHEQLLDRMWAQYRGPLFQAMLELAIGARTDPNLRAQLVGAHQEMAQWNERGAPILYPELADRPELLPLIATGQATMRGLALMGLAGEVDPDDVWPTTRAHILAMNAQVLGDPRLSS